MKRYSEISCFGYDMRKGIIIAFLAVVISFVSLFADQCHAAVLEKIEVFSLNETTDVFLSIDEKVRSRQNYLPASESAPARCYIDLYNTIRDQSVPSWRSVDGKHITKIRTGVYPTKLRVVLDLQEDYTCAAVSISEESYQVKITVSDSISPKAKPGAPINPEMDAATQIQNVTPVSGEDAGGPSGLSQDSLETDEKDTETQVSEFTEATDDGISVWGWAQFYSATDTQKDRGEDHRLHRYQGRLGAGWEKELSSDQLLELHAAVDVDRFFYDSDQADEDTDIKIHETYLQLNRSNWDISFGKQRVRWGKSDQLSPVDSINPQDFRQFITVDLEERALPSWMVRNRWYGESIGIETIVQPWFEESEIEYFDSDWAIYRNLRQVITDDPSSPDWLKDYAKRLRVDENEPSKSLENMSGAARLTWQTEQTDFALSYHYGWETLPTITSFPVKNIDYSGDLNLDPTQDLIFTNEKVRSKYKRQQTVGFEWETALDPIGFRGEIAHIDHVAFLTSDFTSKRKPAIHLVSGVDYTSEKEWYFNLQGSWYYIHNYSDNILYFEENTVSALGEISKPVWRGNLEFAIQYNYTITDQSSYLKPYATLKYFRNLECEVGANIFSGDDDTLLGSYDKADQVYGVIKYSF